MQTIVLHNIQKRSISISENIHIHDHFFLNRDDVCTFDSLESAGRARENLNGADIYSGCCTLKIDFAKVSNEMRYVFHIAISGVVPLTMFAILLTHVYHYYIPARVCVCVFFSVITHFQPEKLNVYKNDSDTSWDYTLIGEIYKQN